MLENFKNIVRTKEETHWMDVTPEMAEFWLNHFNTRNRAIKSRRSIEKMRREVADRTYVSSHQGIAFFRSGVLADGQHRLMAIKEAGVPAYLPVTLGLREQAVEHIDDPIIRTLADVSAVELSLPISNAHQGALAGMFTLHERWWHMQTRHERLGLFAEHSAALIAAAAGLCRAPKGVRMGLVMGVLARVHYKVGPDKLNTIATLLTDGVSTSELEGVIIRLRNQLMLAPGNRMDRRKRYGITERAIEAFLNGETPLILRVPKGELFPLPDEE